MFGNGTFGVTELGSLPLYTVGAVFVDADAGSVVAVGALTDHIADVSGNSAVLGEVLALGEVSDVVLYPHFVDENDGVVVVLGDTEVLYGHTDTNSGRIEVMGIPLDYLARGMSTSSVQWDFTRAAILEDTIFRA